MAAEQAGRPAAREGQITPAPPVGRALLTWEGKALPAPILLPRPRLQEAFGHESDDDQTANRLYHGDNAQVLAHLLESGLRGQVRLIYIDPPFDSSADYTRKIRLRNPRATELGQQIQYSDTWPGDSYLQFMYERLLLLRDLLAEDGSIWLHCDYRQVHRLHLMLEEVFGSENYLNTISWRSQVTRGAKVNAFYFPFSTQYMEIFAKQRSAPTVWHPQRKQLFFTRRQAAAQFMQDERGFFRTSDPGTYSFERLCELHAQGRLHAPYDGEIVIDEVRRRVLPSNGGNIGVKYYLHAEGNNRYSVERGVDNLWDDIPGLGTTPGEDVSYPTQKTEALLRRVIEASTDPGDRVLDCFMGSGTTLAVAQKLDRRWIGCDNNYGAVQTTRRRLQRIIQEQGGQSRGFSLWAEETVAEGGQNEVHTQIRRQTDNPTTIEVILQGYRSAAMLARMATAPGDEGDWHGQIEAVEIDPCYDGRSFRPTVVDAPQKRRERVSGRYLLSAATHWHRGETTRVALRITDVLGAETMVIDQV